MIQLTGTKQAFQKKSQTIDHMLELETLAGKYKSANEKIYFDFVGFKKAYDTVWREGLIYKLLLQKVNGKFLNVIKSMLFMFFSMCMHNDLLPVTCNKEFEFHFFLFRRCTNTPVYTDTLHVHPS